MIKDAYFKVGSEDKPVLKATKRKRLSDEKKSTPLVKAKPTRKNLATQSESDEQHSESDEQHFESEATCFDTDLDSEDRSIFRNKPAKIQKSVKSQKSPAGKFLPKIPVQKSRAARNIFENFKDDDLPSTTTPSCINLTPPLQPQRPLTPALISAPALISSPEGAIKPTSPMTLIASPFSPTSPDVAVKAVTPASEGLVIYQKPSKEKKNRNLLKKIASNLEEQSGLLLQHSELLAKMLNESEHKRGSQKKFSDCTSVCQTEFGWPNQFSPPPQALQAYHAALFQQSFQPPYQVQQPSYWPSTFNPYQPPQISNPLQGFENFLQQHFKKSS